MKERMKNQNEQVNDGVTFSMEKGIFGKVHLENGS
jgi:hypothetical protein